MRDIDYLDLGATLYIPATHSNLESVVIGNRYPRLKSIVICLEDSISHHELVIATKNLQKILQALKAKSNHHYIFIRPRHIENLKEILCLENISYIDGFVLPKITTANLANFLDLFVRHNFYIMPTLETMDVFDLDKLKQLREILDRMKKNILSIRVGSEDILSLIDIRRESSMIIYDYIPFATILSNIINTFRPYGYNISAPVFNSFEELETLKEELKRDVALGIVNKTIINPAQIDSVHNAYRVCNNDLSIAQELLSTDRAILSFNGAMYERSTHLNWAKSIIKRGEIYGTKL